MEKYQDKIFKLLPKAATFSPNRDKRFSGPINLPMISHDARIRRPRSFNLRKGNKNNNRYDNQDDQEEPTSPKISCMGQIKKKKMIKSKRASKESKPVTWSPLEGKKPASVIKRIFSGAIKPGRRSSASGSSDHNDDDHHDDDHHDDDDDHHHRICRPNSLPDRAPMLSQMRRFASGRDSVAGFDWVAAVQVTPVDARYSDEDEDDHDDDFDDEFKIPFSAPIAIGCGKTSTNNEAPLKAKKEINLWKRRTMTPPRPLDLNTMTIRAN